MTTNSKGTSRRSTCDHAVTEDAKVTLYPFRYGGWPVTATAASAAAAAAGSGRPNCRRDRSAGEVGQLAAAKEGEAGEEAEGAADCGQHVEGRGPRVARHSTTAVGTEDDGQHHQVVTSSVNKDLWMSLGKRSDLLRSVNK